MMKRKLVVSGILLFAVSCFAQKNEVDVLFGNTWSFNSNLIVSRPGFLPVAIGSREDSNVTYQLGVARQLADFKAATLSLELNAAYVPTNLKSVFVVPAARFTFMPRSRISPFVSTGVGFVDFLGNGFPSGTGVAFQFGGGFDAKTPVRFLNFRLEARDFLAAQPGSGARIFSAVPGATANQPFRNHALAAAGFVVRF
ncbi:MAG: hypothetical protein ACM3SW_04690 [Actinomycetota bacterium]